MELGFWVMELGPSLPWREEMNKKRGAFPREHESKLQAVLCLHDYCDSDH